MRRRCWGETSPPILAFNIRRRCGLKEPTLISRLQPWFLAAASGGLRKWTSYSHSPHFEGRSARDRHFLTLRNVRCDEEESFSLGILAVSMYRASDRLLICPGMKSSLIGSVVHQHLLLYDHMHAILTITSFMIRLADDAKMSLKRIRGSRLASIPTCLHTAHND